MTTIQDVARSAGVSTATVSRVFSAPDQVAEGTRARVREAVADLGYTPNLAAKTLRTLRTDKILVTVPDISNPFFSQVIRGVEEAATAAGYAVLLGDTRHEEAREDQYAQMLLRKEADGLIFLGHRLPDALAAMVARMGPRTPIVNGCEFSPSLSVSSAHIDNERAAAEVMAHLCEIGHRRIGVITGPLISPISRDRLAGVQGAVPRQAKLKALIVATGDFSIESGEARAGELLDRPSPPTALFCFNDEMAMGALAAIRHRGLKCPDDISVVGFDDIRFARYLDPPLTTISQPTHEIGRRVVKLLLDILSGEAADRRDVTLPHQLVIRGSTAPPPKGPST